MKQLTIPTEALWTGDIDKSAARTSHTLKVEKLKIILQPKKESEGKGCKLSTSHYLKVEKSKIILQPKKEKGCKLILI